MQSMNPLTRTLGILFLFLLPAPIFIVFGA